MTDTSAQGRRRQVSRGCTLSSMMITMSARIAVPLADLVLLYSSPVIDKDKCTSQCVVVPMRLTVELLRSPLPVLLWSTARYVKARWSASTGFLRLFRMACRLLAFHMTRKCLSDVKTKPLYGTKLHGDQLALKPKNTLAYSTS
jgi:hypothetical protein